MSPHRRPNVVFITTDHMRYDCVGANGNPHIRTPVLDRMSANGVSLDRCYVQNPLCMPSRASIWTGRYPQNHRVTTNGIALRKSEITMAHAFQSAGYQTVNVGKLHFLPHLGRDHSRAEEEYSVYGYDINHLSDEPGCYPDAYIRWVEQVAPEHLEAVRVPAPVPGQDNQRNHFNGWVFQAPEEYSHPAWIAHQVSEFIETRNPKQPFLLTAGFYAPHPPLNPPQRYLDMYDQDSLPLPVQHPTEMETSQYKDVTPEEWRSDKAFFYAMCSLVDHYVGVISDALQKAGLLDDTILVFTSDHGESLGDHGRINKGSWNHECLLRVPFIIRWPNGLPSGRRTPGFVESVDIMPTLCELAGVEVPFGVKGRSAAGLLRGNTEDGREDILVEFKDPKVGLVKTLRTHDYKYFRHGDGSEQLYDMREDDEEVFDRSADPAYAGILSAMRELLLARLIEAEDDLPPKTHLY